MIIAFTGMDGSGKTLQAKALTNFLVEEGVRSEYVWSRWSPLFVRPFIGLGKMLFHRSGASEDEQYRSFVHGKRRMFQRPALARFWQTLAFLDYALQVLMKIRLRLRKETVVICDRYVQDLLVDLGTNFGYGEGEMPRLLETRLLTLFPKADLVFLLDLPPEVAFRRKEDVPLSYLQDRRVLYLSMGKLPGVEVLDATTGIQNLMRTIHRKALDFLRRRGLGESPQRS